MKSSGQQLGHNGRPGEADQRHAFRDVALLHAVAFHDPTVGNLRLSKISQNLECGVHGDAFFASLFPLRDQATPADRGFAFTFEELRHRIGDVVNLRLRGVFYLKCLSESIGRPAFGVCRFRQPESRQFAADFIPQSLEPGNRGGISARCVDTRDVHRGVMNTAANW